MTTRTHTLEALVTRMQQLSPDALLAGAIVLLEKGETDLAATWARLAADKLDAQRLLAVQAERRRQTGGRG